MSGPAGSAQAAALAAELERAAAEAVASFADVPEDRWLWLPAPGVWSVGKDAEHLADAALYHQWIVRLTIGERVSSARPSIERSHVRTNLSPSEAAALLRDRTGEGLELIRALSDEQLDLPTRPPRAGNASLATTIERILIGHYRVHRDAIEAKLRTARAGDPG